MNPEGGDHRLKFTYGLPTLVAQIALDFRIRDQPSGLKIVRKAKSLDVFLQSRRNRSLMSPEVVACEFWFHLSEQYLDLGQFLPSLGRCVGKRAALISETVDNKPVQEKDDFLGEICDITTGLQSSREQYEPVGQS